MKDLRERCEKLAKDLGLFRKEPDRADIELIEAFAREIRNEALEEAAGAMRNKGYYEPAIFVDWFRTTALAASGVEEKGNGV